MDEPTKRTPSVNPHWGNKDHHRCQAMTDASAPLVSVVIPAYKAEAHIEETVRSVLNQTYPQVEAVVVNDGSPDKLVDVVQAIDDPRVRLLHQPNRGVAEARNHGIREAQGAFIGLLDSDDVWLPQKVERHLEHFRRSPHLGTSYSRSIFIDGQGAPMGLYQDSKLTDIEPIDMFVRCPIGSGSTPIVRRETWEAIAFKSNHFGEEVDSYFDASPELLLGEDVECWYRLLTRSGWGFEGIADYLTLYRIYGESNSANLTGKADSWERLLDWVAQYDAERVAGFRRAAMSYHDRYLARRAVTNGHGLPASRYALRAMVQYPQLLAEEPGRTLVTLAAALTTCLMPKSVVEKLLGRATGHAKAEQSALIAAALEAAARPD